MDVLRTVHVLFDLTAEGFDKISIVLLYIMPSLSPPNTYNIFSMYIHPADCLAIFNDGPTVHLFCIILNMLKLWILSKYIPSSDVCPPIT